MAGAVVNHAIMLVRQVMTAVGIGQRELHFAVGAAGEDPQAVLHDVGELVGGVEGREGLTRLGD